jgi:hypothetical protein
VANPRYRAYRLGNDPFQRPYSYIKNKAYFCTQKQSIIFNSSGIMTLQYTYDNKRKALGVFIPIAEWKKITKKYKGIVVETETPPSKEAILGSIKDGIRAAKLHQEGEIQLKTAQQLLDEL